MSQLPSAIDMDIYNDITRGRSTLPSKNRSRESSILLNISLQAYYEWIEAMNNLLPNEN